MPPLSSARRRRLNHPPTEKGRNQRKNNMGLLNNKDWSGAYRRTIAKTTAECSIADIREPEPKVGDDGKPGKDSTFISLRLEQDVKDTNGDVIAKGGTVDVTLNTAPNPDNDEKITMMNRISQERFRELVVSALGLDPKTKTAFEEFTAMGGPAALKDRHVIVDFKPSSQGMNSVNKFAAVPKS